MLEETGLVIEPGPPTGVYKNMLRRTVALVSAVESSVGSVSATAEAVEVRWLHADDIAALMTEAYGVRLLDAIHDGPPAN